MGKGINRGTADAQHTGDPRLRLVTTETVDRLQSGFLRQTADASGLLALGRWKLVEWADRKPSHPVGACPECCPTVALFRIDCRPRGENGAGGLVIAAIVNHEHAPVYFSLSHGNVPAVACRPACRDAGAGDSVSRRAGLRSCRGCRTGQVEGSRCGVVVCAYLLNYSNCRP